MAFSGSLDEISSGSGSGATDLLFPLEPNCTSNVSNEVIPGIDFGTDNSCNETIPGTEVWDILLELEAEKTRMLTSTIVYMVILMVIGFFGNTLVIIVYTVRIRKGTTRIFILGLAFADILNNMFGMSGEIIDILNHFTFTNSLMCKFIRFNNYITVFTSIYTLIAVAIDRHRRVCRPHSKQFTVKTAKIMVGIALFVATLITIPAIILNGVHVVELPHGDYCVEIYECTIMNAYDGTMFPKIFIGTQFLMFVASCAIIFILYVMIGREIFIHSRFSFKNSFMRKKNRLEITPVKASNPNITMTHMIMEPNDTVSDANSGYGESEAEQQHMVFRKSIAATKQRKREKSRKIKNRTTLMLVAISGLFILSCLPYLTVSVIKTIHPDYVSSLSETGIKVYNIFLRSYFINSAANPIVYSFCNGRFREEVRRLFHSIQ